MSDQTDIQVTPVPNNETLEQTLERLCRESWDREQALNAEIARLTGPLPVTLQSWSYAREMNRESKAVPYEVSERLEAEVHQLRARLADATAEIAKVNEFRERACAKHREVRDERDQYHSAALQLQARKLALESQCQRMRDALIKIKGNSETNGYVHAGIYEEANAALSSSLDLELLNRVQSVLTQVLESARPNKIINPTMWGAWLGVESLLKSLNPVK